MRFLDFMQKRSIGQSFNINLTVMYTWQDRTYFIRSWNTEILKTSWYILTYHPGISLVRLRKTMKISVKTSKPCQNSNVTKSPISMEACLRSLYQILRLFSVEWNVTLFVRDETKREWTLVTIPTYYPGILMEALKKI